MQEVETAYEMFRQAAGPSRVRISLALVLYIELPSINCIYLIVSFFLSAYHSATPRHG